MVTDKPYASTPDGVRFGPRFLSAPGLWDEPELPVDAGDAGAPSEDAFVKAVEAEPGMAAPPAPVDEESADVLPTVRVGPDGFEIMETLAGVLDAKLFDDRSAAPLPDGELSPVGDRELAAANDAADSVDLSSTLNAIRAFLGGTALAAAGDRFSFAGLMPSGDERAQADDSPLDPFMDAIDPAWMGEIMATLLADGTVMLPDGTITSGLAGDTSSDPMADIPVDGPDGWVV